MMIYSESAQVYLVGSTKCFLRCVYVRRGSLKEFVMAQLFDGSVCYLRVYVFSV